MTHWSQTSVQKLRLSSRGASVQLHLEGLEGYLIVTWRQVNQRLVMVASQIYNYD